MTEFTLESGEPRIQISDEKTIYKMKPTGVTHICNFSP